MNKFGPTKIVEVIHDYIYVSMSIAGDAQFNEAMGYPMVQQWRVRSNLYKVKLSAITLSTGTKQTRVQILFKIPFTYISK